MENDLKITQVAAHLITTASEFNDVTLNSYSPFVRIQLPDNLLWLEGFDKPLDIRQVYPNRIVNTLEEAFKAQINVIHEQLELF